ncbi:unnamed protein product [Psylliodes chrysocephalus]|uniref:Uncharacterized protein n=1 Tax=Psylliodes chrysocephalus TaxID=3402493 RepID=A0A9P0CSR7_9CUCU|nr:unnamed protein product [Psylliodes chrysocephala]
MTSALMLFYTVIAVFLYSGQSIMEYPKCQERNLKENLHEMCSLIPLWNPFHEVTNTVWWSVCACQLLFCSIIFMSTVSVIFLIYNVTLMLISHVNYFKELIINTFQQDDPRVKTEKIKYCIQYHKHIINLGHELSYLVNITVGDITLSSGICIGCIANQSMNELSVRAFMHLFGFCIGFFALCHAGQVIINESSSIKDAIYSTSWYLCDWRTMKDVRFILARSQIPIGLAAPFGFLGYPLYMMIIRRSYSYATLLNQTT